MRSNQGPADQIQLKHRHLLAPPTSQHIVVQLAGARPVGMAVLHAAGPLPRGSRPVRREVTVLPTRVVTSIAGKEGIAHRQDYPLRSARRMLQTGEHLRTSRPERPLILLSAARPPS